MFFTWKTMVGGGCMKISLQIFIVFISIVGIRIFAPPEFMGASKIPWEREAVAFDCNARSSAGGSPFYPFEKTGKDKSAAASRRWHREFEKNGDYGESWFFLVHTKQGGVLFATISITNLGLRTFDGSCDARFYSPEGKSFKFHRDYRRKDISTSGYGFDLTIGGNHLKASENTCHLTIDESPFRLDLNLKRSLPAFQFGNGLVTLYENRSAEWGIGFDLPRASAVGTLTAGKEIFDLAGDGYHDHTWSTIRLPALMSKWYTLRLYQERFSIILHQIHLTPKFGGGLLCAGIIGDGDRLIPIRNFHYSPSKWRKENISGLDIPTELQLNIKTEHYSITGSIKEKRFLDSVDVLGQIAWPLRQLIRSLYAKPFLIRYLAGYDIDVIQKDGTRHRLRGSCIVGLNSN
jgi:hypothetical protein